jgi:hypothetical protein
VDADSCKFVQSHLLRVVAFSFHQKKPMHYFLYPLVSGKDKAHIQNASNQKV